MIPTYRIVAPDPIVVRAPCAVSALNAGLFVSRGRGRHPERVIDSYQLILVNEGMLEMWEGDREYRLQRGHTLLLSPGIRHGGLDFYRPGSSFYWVHFRVDPGIGQEKDRRIEAPKTTRMQDPARLIELFRRFLDDQESGALTPLRGALLVMQMLTEIAEPVPVEDLSSEADVILADRARRFVRAHFHERISTSIIAEKLKSNPDYLGRVFRGVYRRSITRYIHERRMHYARNLLLNSDYNINEIAAACGFRYTNYFLRLFRRYEGMTPRIFRGLFARTHVNTEQ